jgi:glycosyltransferase involved in cell wall biosynthesis
LGLTEERLILTIGRINETKNQMSVLEILPLVNDVLKDVHWAIVGFPSDPSYYRDLQLEISRRHLDPFVHLIPGFSPRSRELVDAYAAADLVVIPSRYEPFGIVLLEAWASRTPVIATIAGGPAELIHDGIDGMLVDVNDPNEMAKRIIEVLDNAALADRLVREASGALSGFTWSVIAGRLASVYRGVLGRPA